MVYYLKILEEHNVENKKKNIISFSLYGLNDIRNKQRNFYKGLFVNQEQAKLIYPDYILRVYIPHTEPRDKIDAIIKSGVETIIVDTNICLRALRFLPYDDPNVDIWLSRDLDSVVNYREQVAVQDWLTNYQDKPVHIMHDHPAHRWTILGGMFGVKNDHTRTILPFILDMHNKSPNTYGVDCDIAEAFFVKDNYIQHHSAGKKLSNSKPFPPHKAIKGKHVGEVINFNNY
jgi:hypothetical protein